MPRYNNFELDGTGTLVRGCLMVSFARHLIIRKLQWNNSCVSRRLGCLEKTT